MNQNKTNRIWLALTILVLAALACQPGGPGPVTTPTAVQTEPTPVAANNGDSSPDQRTQLVHATVQVLMQVKQGNQFESFSWGSGTIISASGLILTNAHVASPASQGEPENEPDRLVIALIESEDKPPVPAYIAAVRAVDGYLDLAVLQITSTIDGSSIDTADLDLPFLQLGNPDEIRIGDHLNIYGFPSIGGETITYTDGNVSGFASDEQIGDRAWIKTDATISGGNSGGLAADDSGQIVGIPTSLGASGSGMDCRPQQDTNDDGRVDNEDFCVPISNFIADVRPINFAKSLIQAAQAGKEYSSPFRLPGAIAEDGTGEEELSNLGWFSSDANCNPGEVVESYDANTLCIVPGFSYSGMTNGEAFREVWTYNGEQFGEYTYSWEWGSEGELVSNMSNEGNPVPEGTYTVEFFAGANSKKLGTAPEVVVGSTSGGTSQPPQEDTITVYGVIFDADSNKPISGAYVFILTPGTTYSQWQSEGFADKYIIASLQTGSNGKFEITGIPRNTQFTIVFSAEGYRDTYGDNLQAGPNDPDRIDLSYGMSK